MLVVVELVVSVFRFGWAMCIRGLRIIGRQTGGAYRIPFLGCVCGGGGGLFGRV